MIYTPTFSNNRAVSFSENFMYRMMLKVIGRVTSETVHIISLLFPLSMIQNLDHSGG